MAELFTVYGETDGLTPSEDLSLNSDLFYDTVSYIRVPKGLKAKAWAKRISGETATTVKIQYTPDVTVASPSWRVLDTQYLASAGEMSVEKRRPAVARGTTGKEAIKISYSQDTADKAYAEFEIELGEEQ